MTREEAIEVLKNHHMWTGEPQEINDVRAENEALYMAIRSLEAWDEIIKHLEATAKELLELEDKNQSYAFAKGITFSVSMIKSHMKEDENVHGEWEWLFNDCVDEMSEIINKYKAERIGEE